MKSEPRPLSFRYQRVLAPLVETVRDPYSAKRLSELLTLLDFNTTLNRSLELSDILDLALFVALGETRASWAGILLRSGEDELLRPAARRGKPDPLWSELRVRSPQGTLEADSLARGEVGCPEEIPALMEQTGAELVLPLRKGGELIGLFLLGPPMGAAFGKEAPAAAYDSGERAFIEALTIAAAASIDNGRIYEELQQVNRRLSFKIFQLDSLFDITQELYRGLDAPRVCEVLLTAAMGQLLATRCGFVDADGSIEVRGVKLTARDGALVREHVSELRGLERETAVPDLPSGPLRELFEGVGFELAVPLRHGNISQGTLLVGHKASGRRLGEEDADFLRSLATQGAAALDNLRLRREWLEKQKIDKELALAREIQRGLFPDGDPQIEGWDIAGVNIPCLTVGGDYYDYLPGPRDTIGLTIADVSGKGTGPALLMAAVQASLRALSGLGELSLEAIISRLNDLVYRSSGASKYVTVFLGWLDPKTGEIVFSNAGHCYPLLLRRDGTVNRLVTGPPVIGLLPRVEVETGRTALAKGDMLVAYTDGLSETTSPGGDEYEESRIIEAAREARELPAREVVGRLVSEVRIFAAEAGLKDDLTLMVVKRL